MRILIPKPHLGFPGDILFKRLSKLSWRDTLWPQTDPKLIVTCDFPDTNIMLKRLNKSSAYRVFFVHGLTPGPSKATGRMHINNAVGIS